MSLCSWQHLLARIYARVNVYPTFMAMASHKKLRCSETIRSSLALVRPQVPPLNPQGPPTRRAEQMPHLFDDHFKNVCPARLLRELQRPLRSVRHYPCSSACAQNDTLELLQLDHELQYTRIQFVLHHACSGAY